MAVRADVLAQGGIEGDCEWPLLLSSDVVSESTLENDMTGMKDAARRIPGVAAAQGAIAGALATEQDLPIKDYDKQSAEDIVGKLSGFSQRELRMIDAYERKREGRTTITDRISKLTGEEPWSGYDELGVDAVAQAVSEGSVEDAKRARGYERGHKDRSGVVEAADRRINTK